MSGVSLLASFVAVKHVPLLNTFLSPSATKQSRLNYKVALRDEKATITFNLQKNEMYLLSLKAHPHENNAFPELSFSLVKPALFLEKSSRQTHYLFIYLLTFI